MSTKFILHGGFNPEGSNASDDFFREILTTAPARTEILLVCFAKAEEKIPEAKAQDIEQFEKNKDNKILHFVEASKEHFVSQVEKADVIYLRGGHTGLLLKALKQIPNLDLKKLFVGKIVAGDSAGANILCRVFLSLYIGVGEGFGVLPFKVICHGNDENKDKLTDIQPELETVFLPEYQYKVFYTE